MVGDERKKRRKRKSSDARLIGLGLGRNTNIPFMISPLPRFPIVVISGCTEGSSSRIYCQDSVKHTAILILVLKPQDFSNTAPPLSLLILLPLQLLQFIYIQFYQYLLAPSPRLFIPLCFFLYLFSHVYLLTRRIRCLGNYETLAPSSNVLWLSCNAERNDLILQKMNQCAVPKLLVWCVPLC